MKFPIALSRRRRPRVLGRGSRAQARLLRSVSWEMDVKERRFTFVSPWVVELFGYPLASWYERNFWAERIHPDDRAWAVEFCVECTSSGKHHEFEYRMIDAGGRTLWVRDIVKCLDAPGGPMLAGLMIDVTNFRREEARGRVRTLETLRRRKTLVRLATTDHSSLRGVWRRLLEEDARALRVERVGLWTFAEDGASIVCRDLFTSSSSSHTRGQALRARDFPDYFKALEGSWSLSIQDARSDPRTPRLFERYLKPLGITSMLDVPLRRRGRLAGILCHEHVGPPREWSASEEEFAGAVADIAALAWESAERKKASEQRRRLNVALEKKVELRTAELQAVNEELEAFASSLVHDLRAPLRHINGYAKLLLRDLEAVIPPESARMLGRIAAEAVHQGLLIDGLVALASAGKRGLDRRLVEPGPIVAAALESLQAESAARWVQLRVGDLPSCRADPMLLAQVFAHLLSNAFKFTRGVDPALIEVGALPGGVYFVKDNGKGFEARQVARLFKIFERHAAAHDIEGTGVGLAIVKRIVDRHGGRIWAESEPGKGAVFYFTFESGH